MSKSKGNVVSPDDMIARYGADATRMYALFAAPPDRDLDWQEDGVAGVSRFLGRVYRLATKYARRRAARQREPPRKRPPARRSSCCASSTRRSPRSRWTSKAAGTSTPASPPSWNSSTNCRRPMRNSPPAKFPRPWCANCCARWFCCWLRSRPTSPPSCGGSWASRARCFRAPWPRSNPELAKEDEIEIPVQINGKLVTRGACSGRCRFSGRRGGGSFRREGESSHRGQDDCEGDRGAPQDGEPCCQVA